VPFGSVKRLVEYEDYVLRLLDDVGIPVARTYGIVALTPNDEYMLVTQFFEGARNVGDSEIDDAVVDEGLRLVRTLWDAGLAHRDLKPANLLAKDGHLQLVDVSGLEVRPTAWRQAVDLANMMLTLSLQTDRTESTSEPHRSSRRRRSLRPSPRPSGSRSPRRSSSG
jgi:tRNA A-37 threonylcarbamoyl transferase component Bud32